MRGRKPKPTQLQISEGDPQKRGRHKLQQKLASEPVGHLGLPECPAYLNGLARDRWAIWRADLEDLGLDYKCSAAELEGACVCYARAVMAEQMVDKHGLIIAMERPLDEQGQPIGPRRMQANPAIGIANKAWEQVRGFCSNFGLNPASRTRVKVEDTSYGQANLLKSLQVPYVRKTKDDHIM
jgi:P27 family predicted phage terminase small subunit